MDSVSESTTPWQGYEKANPSLDLPFFVYTPNANYRYAALLRASALDMGLLLLWGIAYYLNWLPELVLWAIGLLVMGFIVIYTIYVGLSWKRFRCELRTDQVYLRSGLLVDSQQYIPYNRIQHVILTQDVYSRIWNLAKLEIYAAGNLGGDIQMPGLTFEQAEQAKNYLIEQIQNRTLVHEERV